MLLKDKKVLIIGSSRGIGLAVAKLFLEHGAVVTLNSRKNLSELLSVMALMESYKNKCFYVEGDLSGLESPFEIVEKAYNLMNGMDCLICNAGTCFIKDFKETDFSDYDKIFNLNFRGFYFASEKFAQLVGKRNNDACIIFTGSINGLQAEKGQTLYNSSKGAIHMLTKSLALDLAEQGIRVNCVAPGFIATDLTKEAHTNPVLAKKIADMIPMKRIGLPEDNAGAYLFFASEKLSGYVTGQILYVDGGISASQGSPVGDD